MHCLSHNVLFSVTGFLDLSVAMSHVSCDSYEFGVHGNNINTVMVDDKIYEVVTGQIGVECKYAKHCKQIFAENAFKKNIPYMCIQTMTT